MQQHQQMLQQQQHHMQSSSQHPTPRKAHTAPGYFSPRSAAASVHASPAQGAALLLREDGASPEAVAAAS